MATSAIRNLDWKARKRPLADLRGRALRKLHSVVTSQRKTHSAVMLCFVVGHADYTTLACCGRHAGVDVTLIVDSEALCSV